MPESPWAGERGREGPANNRARVRLSNKPEAPSDDLFLPTKATLPEGACFKRGILVSPYKREQNNQVVNGIEYSTRVLCHAMTFIGQALQSLGRISYTF